MWPSMTSEEWKICVFIMIAFIEMFIKIGSQTKIIERKKANYNPNLRSYGQL